MVVLHDRHDTGGSDSTLPPVSFQALDPIASQN